MNKYKLIVILGLICTGCTSNQISNSDITSINKNVSMSLSINNKNVKEENKLNADYYADDIKITETQLELDIEKAISDYEKRQYETYLKNDHVYEKIKDSDMTYLKSKCVKIPYDFALTMLNRINPNKTIETLYLEDGTSCVGLFKLNMINIPIAEIILNRELNINLVADNIDATIILIETLQNKTKLGYTNEFMNLVINKLCYRR